MPRYIDVVHATHETATKILALREGKSARQVHVTTNGGATASVGWRDGSPIVTLNMPSLPPDSVLTRAEADRLVAFIGHECCHVLHTSRKAWDQACSKGDRVRIWVNCLEDVRIEAKEIRAGVFPALRSLLAGMSNHLHLEALPKASSMGVTIGTRVADAPFVASVLGRITNGYAIPAAHALRGDMSPTVRQLVNHALAGVKRCRTTDAVLTLALNLVQMEQAQRSNQPGQPGQDASGGAQDGQDGQDASDGAQDGQDASDGAQDGQDASGGAQDGQDGQNTPGGAQDGQNTPGGAQDGQDGQNTPGGAQDGQDGQDTSGGAQDGQDSPPVSDGSADLAQTVQTVAQRAGVTSAENYARDNRGHALATVTSTIQPVSQDAPSLTNRWHARQLDQRLAGNSVLHGQIGRLLVSEEVQRRTHHESSGRLDRRALVRMRAGAVDVYSQRDDTPGIDTALLVLIDGSQSMSQTSASGKSRMALATTTAWHVTRAAETANARVCVAAFHTPPREFGTRHRGGLTGATVAVIKPWALPVDACANRLAMLEPDGYTPLSPAIITAAGMLAEVNATRRIMLVLTDGECDFGNDGVTAACRLAEDLGVEVVGIGMDCATVIDAFPKPWSINVTDLAQLSATGLGVLVGMLEDANPRGGGND